MAPYEVPTVKVFQDFREELATDIPVLNALIIGPRYDFLKYTTPDDKADAFVGAYDKDLDTSYNYPGRSPGNALSVVEQAGVEVYFDEVQAEYYSHIAGAGPYEFRNVAGHVNRITTTAPQLTFKDFTNAEGTNYPLSTAVFNSRDVSELDVVEVEGIFPGPIIKTHRSGVREFVNDVIVATVGAAAADAGNQGAVVGAVAAAAADGGNTGDDTVVSGGAYAGSLVDNVIADTYTVEVVVGGAPGAGAAVSVASLSGTDDIAVVAVAAFGAPEAVGTLGITFTYTDGGDTVLTIGDKWTVAATKTIDALVGTSGGAFIGAVDTTYTVEVTKGGIWGVGEVTVTSSHTDSSGPTVITAAATTHLIGTLGLEIQFAANTQGGLVFGDKWTVAATSEKQGALNTIVLEDRLPQEFLDNPATNLTARFYLVQNDVSIPRYRIDVPAERAWQEDADYVELQDSIKITDTSWFDGGGPIQIPIDQARIHITYRTLRLDNSDNVRTVAADRESIELAIGRIDVLNPLAYGVFKASENSAGVPIKYISLPTDDLEGYRAVYKTLEEEETVYSFVPLTFDTDVHAELELHVDQLSTPAEGRWRIGLICKELVTQEFILEQYFNPTSQLDEDYLATVTDDPAIAGVKYDFLEAEVTQDTNFITMAVIPGHKLQYNFRLDIDGIEIWDEYTVTEVISNTTLKFEPALSAAEPIPSKFKIYKPLTKTEQAEAMAAEATAIENRRMHLFWPDYPGVGGLFVPGYYMACSVAGMIAALPPHQGFTNFEILGWDDMSKSFVYFTREQLNIMAAAGVYIVTQQVLGSPVYTRHQLSTDMSTLNFRELSVTKNVDNLSYYFKSLLEPFIGVYTVNPETIETIYATLRSGIVALKSEVYPRIGGQLIDGNVLSVEQDDTFFDQVRADIDVTIPYPLNYLDLHILI